MMIRPQYRFLFLYWLFVFIFSLLLSIFAREYLIPNYYVGQVGGDIPGDPVLYKNLGYNKYLELKEFGLSRFELRTEGQGPAGVASLLYLVSDSPYIIVLLNSFLISLAVLFLVLLLMNWFSFKISIISTLPLAVSPYMFVWFSQLNKDSFVLSGALMFIYGVTSLALYPWGKANNTYALYLFILIVLIGILSISIARPYVNQIGLIYSSILFSFIFLLLMIRRVGVNTLIKYTAFILIVICFAYLGSFGGASNKTIERFYKSDADDINSMAGNANAPGVTVECLKNISEWEKSPWVPGIIDRKLKAMMGQRCLMFSLLQTHTNKATLYSIVDTDILPGNSYEAIGYLPRGAQLGILSPFPVHWMYFKNNPRSFFYTITPIETLLVYIGLLSITIMVIRHKSWTLLIPVLYSFTVMAVYGFSVPFLGSLYRYRYPWWMLLLCLGIAAALYQLNVVRKNMIKK